MLTKPIYYEIIHFSPRALFPFRIIITFYFWTDLYCPSSHSHPLFLGKWGSILSAIAFWVILFTGRYPKSMFEYQVQLLRWQLRLNARKYNLSDDYPPFLLTDLFHTTVSTAFDRSYEKEADQFALNLLEEAKISPTAMASFF